MSISEEIKTRLSDALIDGDADLAEETTLEALEAGSDPVALINDVMIPALTVVGDQFQAGEVFLPELMLAGDAAQRVSKHVEAAIAAQGRTTESKGTVVIGTVMGDIHDIGKNIVALMLRNHGFKVIDLGKDVSAEKIVAAIREYRPALVGLSALMTTTMVRMEEVTAAARDAGLDCRFMVGGAVVSESYAASVGAAYARDGVEAVRAAKRLTGGH